MHHVDVSQCMLKGNDVVVTKSAASISEFEATQPAVVMSTVFAVRRRMADRRTDGHPVWLVTLPVEPSPSFSVNATLP